MEDLIKREDAIKYCKLKADHYRKRLARIEAQGDAISYDPTEQINGFKDEIAIYESFVKELEDIPSAEPKQEWIPCSERLPEEGIRVITFDTDGDINIMYFDGHDTEDNYCIWKDDLYIEWCDIIAWMPLPKPYGERKGE